MQLTIGGDFDERQKALAEHIVRAIKLELERVQAPSEVVSQLTGSIAFAVLSLIDGTASAEFEGKELSPHLTFPIDGERLLYAGGNSWMHEYVYRLLPEILPAP